MKASEIATGAALVVVSFGVLCLLGEVALRLHTRSAIYYDVEMTRYANEFKLPAEDPRQGDVHRPGASGRLMGVQVDISSVGLRDDEYPVERNEKARLAFLGDSLTFGWGVEKDEMFETRIERELGDTEILNFAAGNYNTEQQVERFLTVGLAYEPDAVVVFYFINDAEPTPTRSPWAFLSRSRMFTFVWSRLKTVRARYGPQRTFLEYYADLYAEGQPGWANAKEALRRLHAVCREHEMELGVVILPELHEIVDYPFVEQHAKLVAFLTDEGIPVLDLLGRFRGETDPMRLWVALDDAHPNPEAHAMIAEAVLPWLVRIAPVTGGG